MEAVELAVILFAESADVISHGLNVLLESLLFNPGIFVFRHPLLVGHQ